MNVVTALIITSLTGPTIAAIISKWQQTIYGETGVSTIHYLIGLLPIVGTCSVLIDALPYSNRSLKVELYEANQLMKCDSCGKYSRKYQRKLATIKSGKGRIICPHENCRDYYLSWVYEERKWHAVHRDCPKLTVWGFIRYRLTINKIEKINENLAEIDSYMEYEKTREGVAD